MKEKYQVLTKNTEKEKGTIVRRKQERGEIITGVTRKRKEEINKQIFRQKYR